MTQKKRKSQLYYVLASALIGIVFGAVLAFYGVYKANGPLFSAQTDFFIDPGLLFFGLGLGVLSSAQIIWNLEKKIGDLENILAKRENSDPESA